MIGGTNIVAIQEKPADGPETWEGERKGNTNTFTGVSSLMENLINELEQEFQKNEFDEKTAQEDYEEMLADAKKKASADAKKMASDEKTRATKKEELATTTNELADTNESLAAEVAHIAALHGECDFLIANYD